MIDYIEFQVNNIPLAKSFYQHLFNWHFTDYGEDYCEFTDQRLKGGFAKVTTNPNQDIAAGLISPLIVFYSEALEDMYEKVVTTEAKMIKDIFSFPGGRRFEFFDPFGHRLAVWSDKQ